QPRWRTRAHHGPPGHAWPSPVRWPAGDEHSECEKPALAATARKEQPLYRAGDFLLRIRGHQAPQDARLVRPGPGQAPLRLRRPLDALARPTRPQERTRRWRARALRLPDDGGQRDRADPSQGNARHHPAHRIGEMMPWAWKARLSVRSFFDGLSRTPFDGLSIG